MTRRRSFSRWALAGLLLAATPGMLAACGGSSKKTAAKAAKVSITISEAGKSSSYSLPATIKGGLVDLSITNSGKGPHGAQLVRLEGNHTPQQALQIVNSNNPNTKTPDWIRGQGGVGAIAPGQTVTAALNLPAGKYFVVDASGPGSSGPPGYRQFTVTAGKDGSLPSTPTTIDGANPSKDHYRWDVSGAPLKAGRNTVTFKSAGKQTLHLLSAFRLNGNATKAQIIKALKSNGAPPKFVDQTSFYSSAVLDGGLSQTTPLTLARPGKYVLFCPLTDRQGGKPHFEEGMLTTVTVK